MRQLPPRRTWLASISPPQVGRAGLGEPHQVGRSGLAEPPLFEVGRAGPAAPGSDTLASSRLALAPSPYASTQPGVVLDYTLLASQTNFAFAGDTTYYVTNAVNLSGTTTLEGGAVIKFAPENTGARVNLLGPLDCRTAPYRPASLVARDDNTIGELLPDSTGTPSNYYGTYGLYFMSAEATAEVAHVRYSDLRLPVAFNGPSLGRVRHSQIVNCKWAVYGVGYPVQVQNVLVVNQGGGGRVFYGSGGASFDAQQLTVHTAENLHSGITLTLTNSILAVVATNQSYSGSPNLVQSDASGLFTGVGAGAHYLAGGGGAIDGGTTNLEAQLLAELRTRTTAPPWVWTNALTTDAMWGPWVARDDDALPDLGYHYLPMDYALNEVTLQNATVVLTNGVVLGTHGWRGVVLGAGAKLSSGGSATTPNVIARYNTVQEGSGTNWAYAGWTAALFPPQTAVSPAPVVDAAFTVFGQPAGGRHLNGPGVGTYTFRDCEFGGGEISFDSLGVGSTGIELTLKNCLLEGVLCSLTSHNAPATLSLWNCLLWHGHATFAPAAGGFSVHDTLFDQTAIAQGGSVTNGYNGYVNCATNLNPRPQPATDVILGSLSYGTGPLGRYYQVSTNLIDRGSRSAADAGLYHYTVTTNQVKEANSTVDIGLHYVACANGVPVDTDGEGLADYLEDKNGNGSRQTGETDVADPDTDYDGRNDLQELADGTDPTDAGSVMPVCLAWFRFSTNTWVGEQGQVPVTSAGVTNAAGWSGLGASLSATNALLTYRAAETNGSANLNFRSGALRMQYRADWWSNLDGSDIDYDLAGNGPGHWVRLLEAGSPTGTNGYFGLLIDPGGTNLVLMTGNGTGAVVTNLMLPIKVLSSSVRTNDWNTRVRHWHDVAAAWSPTVTRLALGTSSTSGGGVTNAPLGLRGLGFGVGQASPGTNGPCGWIDELELFNHPVAVSASAPLGFAVDPGQSAETLTFGWQSPTNALVYLQRRPLGGGSWTWLGRSWTGSMTDATATPGTQYEYRLASRMPGDDEARTGLSARSLEVGYRLPPLEYRGRVLVVTSPSYATNLVAELAQFRTNLVGDGWDVSFWTNAVPHDDNNWFNQSLATYNNAVQGIRTNVSAFHDQAPNSTNVVVLVGHVAIPYSGTYVSEDGHGINSGAWPADLYYADLDGQWSDAGSYTNVNNATRHNMPGDAKWDQGDGLPTNALGQANLELGLGRIDLRRLDAFAQTTNGPVRSEDVLLKQYFIKNAAFRSKATSYPVRLVWQDMLPDADMTVSVNRHGPSWFGPCATNLIVGDLFTNGVAALWGAQAGYGDYNAINHCTNGCSNMHTTVDLAKLAGAQVPQIGFYLLRGSYFAEWNINYDQFLRACLAMTNHGLAAMWVERTDSPWSLQRLALGECLGQGLQRTVSAVSGVVSVRTLYVMGDPTLRPWVVAPPTGLTAVKNGTNTTLSWTAPPESGATYHVYRSTNSALTAASQFIRLTAVPQAGTTFIDSSPPPGSTTTYLVRALALTQTGCGSYTNLSQAALAVP